MSSADADSQQLLFDLFHEIGNLVAAIRLQAHLLDEDLGPVGLARASIEIEGLGARTSALLGLARPLMSGLARGAFSRPADVMMGVEDLLRDLGLRSVELATRIEGDLPTIPIDRTVLHPLLSFLAADALEALGGKGELAIGARRVDGWLELYVTDSAEADPSLEGWQEDGRRGRGLAVTAAQRLLETVGGRARVSRENERTHVALLVPTEA